MIEDDCIFGFSLFSTSMGWLPRPMAVSSGTQTDQVGLTELGTIQVPQDMDGCSLQKDMIRSWQPYFGEDSCHPGSS